MNLKDLSGQNLGRYHVIEPLGQGGMASVFKAFDTSLERYVAIKIIRPDLDSGNDNEFLKRFQREARALAQLDHPFILKVLDYGEQDGLPYLVMPFVPGGTLKQKMGVPLSSAQAAALLAPIARALEYAHHQNIIHRDVKPANILISQAGAPLLSDFGIAKIISSEASAQLTATGVGIGTPDYMAPEQWMGVADPGTDIYSLGVVFYEMVTGHRPFTADTPAAVLVKHLRDPLPRPKSFVAGLPDETEQLLYKALAKEPKNRFQDMGDFANALEKLARGEKPEISDLPVDMETIQSLDATALAASAQATTRQPDPTRIGATIITPARAPAAPPATSSQAFKIGLIALIVLAAISAVCVLGGGALFMTRSLLPGRSPTTITITLPPGATAGPITAPSAGRPASSQPTARSTSTETPTEAATPTNPPLTSIDGLPDDVPLLPENNGDLTTSINQDMHMYSFTSNLPVDKIKEFYKTGMLKNGWKQVNETTSAKSFSWVFMKDDNTRMVMVIINEIKNGTQISLMVTKQ